jgi:hypothetical protein
MFGDRRSRLSYVLVEQSYFVAEKLLELREAFLQLNSFDGHKRIANTSSEIEAVILQDIDYVCLTTA